MFKYTAITSFYILILSANLLAQAWTVHDIDDEAFMINVTIDPAGNPAVAYMEFDNSSGEFIVSLFFSQYNGTSWMHELVLDTADKEPILEFAPDGTPHIAYFGKEGDSNTLNIATKGPTGWATYTIYTSESSFNYPFFDLAIGAGGHPYVLHGHQDVFLTYFDGSSWQTESLPDAPPFIEVVSLEISDDGVIHVVYTDHNDSLYYIKENGVWTQETLFDGFAWRPIKMALDPDGEPRIVYYDGRVDSIIHMQREDGVWEESFVDNTEDDFNPTELEIVVDPTTGESLITYQHETNFHVRFARQSAQGWLLEDAWPLNDVRSLSIDVDQNGRPAIAFMDRKERNHFGVKLVRPPSTGSNTEDFALWLDGYHLTGADALADADPDQDSLPNLLEYAFQLDPETPDFTALIPTTGTSGLPVLHEVGGILTYEWIERTATDLSYSLQGCENLETEAWEAVDAGDISSEVIDEKWMRKSLTIPQNEGRHFWRLEVLLAE